MFFCLPFRSFPLILFVVKGLSSGVGLFIRADMVLALNQAVTLLVARMF